MGRRYRDSPVLGVAAVQSPLDRAAAASGRSEWLRPPPRIDADAHWDWRGRMEPGDVSATDRVGWRRRRPTRPRPLPRPHRLPRGHRNGRGGWSGFSAHSWSSAINTAASLHVLAISQSGDVVDFKPHESPVQHELVDDPWLQEAGALALRADPGLGVTVRDDVVQRLTFA